MDRFDARAFLAVAARYRGTAAFLVPTMLVRVLEEARGSGAPATLRTVVYGGASMPVGPLARALEVFGAVFVQIYGLTESTWPVAALSRSDHLRREGEDEPQWRARLASCGKPTAIGELRIVDENRDVDTGQCGEIWVRGRNTMSGYWSAPAAQFEADAKGLDAQGWMHTGDIGVRDAEGYLTIVDRLHDMIVTGGFNVYPREVENVLCSHPAVLEAAVFGRPDEEWGETVNAAVVLKPGARAREQDLVDFCARHVAGFKKPRSLAIVERLPRNPAGKILRRALR
jgi:acyl-CoA synthetase (AMP-forming)/AMP-acid ligase II